MARLIKSTAFKVFAVIAAALLAGSAFALVSRSGSSPLTTVTGVVFSPLSRLASRTASALSHLPISFRSASVLSAQVDALKAENERLQEQLVDYEEAKHKNEFYQQFLGLKESHSDYSFAEAAIIGRDAANHFGSFTLNKGALDDIAVNDPVIYGRYLVGVVASVTPTQCTVNTILNPHVNVSAYEVRTRDLGYVTTTTALAQEGQCHMPGLAADTSITVGGIVCTSGVGGIYPRDLILGTIVDVVDGTADISASAIITPSAPLDQLTDVCVITAFNGQNAR